MTVLAFTLILLVGAYAAGLLGSLTGLGGGVVVIPLLTLCFGVDFHYAVGTALVASIATSSGSGAAYVKEGITNIRLGMLLEIATTLGAVAGAAVAIYLNNSVLAVIFGGVLTLTALSQRRKHEDHTDVKGSDLARRLKLFGTYPDKNGQLVPYQLTNVAGGFGVMLLAGLLSGILGIGSGVLKVLAMDTCMKVPFKVSTTTSNFMIGVTACASAVVYIQRGNIVPGIAFPIMIGVLLGALHSRRRPQYDLHGLHRRPQPLTHRSIMQKPDIQQLIGNTLRRGVTLACVLAALGGLYYLIAHGADAVPDYRHFDPHTAAAQTDYTSLMGIVRGVAALNAHSCIQLGVVALILTPILRVVLSLFDFTLERDWLYAAITAIVLAVIVVNSIGGF